MKLYAMTRNARRFHRRHADMKALAAAVRRMADAHGLPNKFYLTELYQLGAPKPPRAGRIARHPFDPPLPFPVAYVRPFAGERGYLLAGEMSPWTAAGFHRITNPPRAERAK